MRHAACSRTARSIPRKVCQSRRGTVSAHRARHARQTEESPVQGKGMIDAQQVGKRARGRRMMTIYETLKLRIDTLRDEPIILHRLA